MCYSNSIEYHSFLGETLQREIGNYLYSGGCTYYSTYILQQLLQLWHRAQCTLHSALDQSFVLFVCESLGKQGKVIN